MSNILRYLICVDKKATTEYENGYFWEHIVRPRPPPTPVSQLIRQCMLITRKRAIAKALQLKGHSDFAPVDLAYYQHFLFSLFENIAFWEVLPSPQIQTCLLNVDKERDAT